MRNLSHGLTSKLSLHLTEFIVFQVIAGLSFAGNLLICALFLRKKNLLKKSYNIYFLILTLLDILITITMAITYVIVLSDVIPFALGSGRLGEFLCRVLWSRWLVYCLYVLSVYICLLLTMERWCAVVKPLNYQGNPKKKKIYISLMVATLIALIFTCSFPLEVNYDQLPGQTPCCTWKSETDMSRGAWSVFQFSGQVLIPSLVMTGLFCHIMCKTHISVAPLQDIGERRHSNAITRAPHTTQRTVTKMIATASFFMILCLVPNQIYFMLSKFGVFSLDTTVHHYLEALTFLNLCINPVIYGVTSQTFSKGYWEVLLGLCPMGMRVRLAQSRGGLGESLGSVVFLVHTLHRRRSYDWRFEGIRASVAVKIESNAANGSEVAIATPSPQIH